jgi:polyisoprenoid-binding protein YceI
MRRICLLGLSVALVACGSPRPAPGASPPAPAAQQQPVANSAPAGEYALDMAHTSLIVRLDHLSFSHFTARFTKWEARLRFDPAAPERSELSVSIDPRSITSDNPPAGFIDTMQGADFLDAAKYPQINFRSTRIVRSGADRAEITGDLTLHGVTKPVTLEARFNGGYPGMSLDPHARIGFSAHGVFKRSDFAMSYGLPPPGTTMGVGDGVEIIMECEMSGPAWTPGPSPRPPASPQP